MGRSGLEGSLGGSGGLSFMEQAGDGSVLFWQILYCRVVFANRFVCMKHFIMGAHKCHPGS